jgi:hypothetical protein
MEVEGEPLSVSLTKCALGVVKKGWGKKREEVTVGLERTSSARLNFSFAAWCPGSPELLYSSQSKQIGAPSL